MLQHRCPWCGEKIQILDFICSKAKCPYCKESLKLYNKWFAIIFIIYYVTIDAILSAKAEIALRNNRIIEFRLLFICEIIIIIAFFIYLCLRVPYKRNRETEKKTVPVFVQWEKYSNRGLFNARFSVPNGEIFPTCFLDTEGNPISTPVCVVLENLKWEKGRRCRCTIKVVLDEVPEEGLFGRGNRFYLYHNRKKIAEGEIT